MKLTIYSVNGEIVTVLTDAMLNKGFHEVGWDGRNQAGATVSNGVYIYELRTGDQKIVKKMLFSK